MVLGVEFEEDSFGGSSRPRPQDGQQPASSVNSSAYTRLQDSKSSNERGLSGWLIRHGLARSPATAQTILIVVIVVNIILTYVVVKYFL